ncbi:MAG: hypothetical protein ACREIF_06735 [Chthoniobacterales bacterium]
MDHVDPRQAGVLIARPAATEKLSLNRMFLVRQILKAVERSLVSFAWVIRGQFAFNCGETRF